MGVMSVITNPSTAEVPVRTRIWCTVPMVVCASFACLAQVSFASQQYAQDSAPYLWMIACVMYFIICFPLSMLVQYLEKRSKRVPKAKKLRDIAPELTKEA